MFTANKPGHAVGSEIGLDRSRCHEANCSEHKERTLNVYVTKSCKNG